MATVSDAAPRLGAGLPGLYVDLGYYDHRNRVWIRHPTADFTCRYGCSWSRSGAAAVAEFCAVIDRYHAQHCTHGEDPARGTDP